MSHRFNERVGISVALFAALAGCHRAETDPRTQPPLVRTAIAQPAEGGTREFTGVVSARVQSDLGFRVGGKVVERLVNAGEVVRRGQPLMRIDRTDLALATTASLGTVEAARARAIQTAADERRLRDLVSAGAVSASAYDQAKAASDAAQAQLRAALAQANVARNEARYSTLAADADGTVVETLAEPGQVVAAGQVVVRLAHAGPREASVDLPETLRPAIGSTATATIFGNNAVSQARLRQLSDAADPTTRTYEARYVLEGAATKAPLGATVSIRVPVPGLTATAHVPLAAIYDNGLGPGVWMVGAGPHPTVSWRPLTLVALGEEDATVRGKLRPGERFVALGAHLLHQGEAVRIAATDGDLQ